MAAPKITAIVDKDLGQVFGAVLERNATDKLPVGSVASDFPIRAAVASGTPPLVQVVLEIPSEELDTIAVVNTAVLEKPGSFVVISGAAAAGTSPTWGGLKKSAGANPVEIDFTTTLTASSLSAKVIFFDHTTNETKVIPVQKIDKGNTVNGDWTLQVPGFVNSHTYDILLLVEKHTALLQTGEQPA